MEFMHPSFEIPAGSFAIFVFVSLILWVALYDCAILPLASRVAGRPVQFSPIQRMGFGILVSCLSMIVSGTVENFRRNAAIGGDSEHSQTTKKMSAMWLVPQNFLTGLAEALNAIAQNEFYISEFPRSMSSIAATMVGVGMSGGSLLASFVMNSIDSATKRGGKDSWVSSDINKGHYDYYCWILAGLSLLNYIYFLVCSREYGPCVNEKKGWGEEGDM